MRCERGQATVEALAMVPVLVVVAALAAQGVASAWAWDAASAAARSGARAAAAGRDPAAAARAALPPTLRRSARIRIEQGVVMISVRAPGFLPLLPAVVRAEAGA